MDSTEKQTPRVSDFNLKQLLHEKWPDILFWTLAAIILFLFLGGRPIAGSEGRWGCVVREMLNSGDYWHPTVNYESYFDKPLVSYWLILLCSLFNGREVSELVVRIPSAIAALGVLWSVRYMARRLWHSERTAQAASWMLLGTYGFVYWGRLGEADMLNLALSTLAVAWYLHCREEPGFRAYLIFGALCAVGGHTKGMSAIAIPVVAVLVDILLSDRIRRHLNWKLLCAVLLSVGLYLLPFLGASVFGNTRSDSGLALALRENVVRFFNAFDHKGPWYIYFVYLPELLLPWSPFVLLALVWAFRNWRILDRGEQWLCGSIVAIFAVFSLSESKRVYYILPILPFCALLTGRFLSATSGARWKAMERLRLFFLRRVYTVMLVGICALLILAFPVGYFVLRSKTDWLYCDFWGIAYGLVWSAPFFAVLAFLAGRAGKRLEKKWRNSFYLYRNAVCLAVLVGISFSFVQPLVEAFTRSTRPFFSNLRKTLDVSGIPCEQVAFLQYTYIDPTYYLGYMKQVRVLGDDEQLRAFLNENPTAVVIAQRRHLDMVQDSALKERVSQAIAFAESRNSWDRKGNFKKKCVVAVVRREP